VGGLTLLERKLLQLLGAGIQKVVVVVGHDADRVGEIARGVAPGRVEVVRAECWEAGNGDSLGAAEQTVHDEKLFLIVTADHLFGGDAVERLLEVGEPAALVDPEAGPKVLEEGTRVPIVNGLALAFGKELDAPCVDCGVFLVPPGIFDCQKLAAAEGDHSLAGALTRLAKQLPVMAVSLPGHCWWVDVDTPEDLRGASRRIRRSLAKPGDGPVSRRLNRPLSTRISMALATFGVAPDLVTVFVFLTSLAAALALVTANGLLAGILVQLASVLDGVDGELARLQLRSSTRGAILDAVLDRVADSAILVAVGLWALGGHYPAWVVLLMTGSAVSGAFLSMALKDRAAAFRLLLFPERFLGYFLGGRDGRLFLVALFAVLGQPLLALLAVTVTSWVAAAVRLGLVWWREVPTRSLAP
jgi:CDP-L-myo-inositol myo-inositolphosphotransferase